MFKNDYKTYTYKDFRVSGKRFYLFGLGMLVFYGAAAVFVSLVMAVEQVFS